MAALFKQYADLAMSDPAVWGLRPVIEKELLHYEILAALSQEGLLKGLVFQGGTSLRLCHGAVRYSEDLDFSGGPGFTAREAGDIAGAVRKHISGRYELPVDVIPPKEKPLSGNDPIRVSSWSIRIETQPGGRNMPAQRIKIDIDTSRSHTAEKRGLQVNYGFLPHSYGDLIIPVQSLTEIMANKLVAFPVSVQGRNRPRHRDIWDLRWMARRNIRADLSMISAKASEHGVEAYENCLETAIEKVSGIVESAAFFGEMSRFLPSDILGRSLSDKAWRDDAARTLVASLQEVLDSLRGEPRRHELEF